MFSLRVEDPVEQLPAGFLEPFGGYWTDILDIAVSGLSTRGREYVRLAHSPEWQEACDQPGDSGRAATT